MTISGHLGRIWRLRWPLLATHVVVVVATLALITPLVTGALHLGLRASGSPALTDQEIAAFLFSPLGAVLGLIGGSLYVTAVVLELAVMIEVLATAETGKGNWGISALQAVAMRVPRLLQFAGHLIIRLLAILLPVAAILGLLYLWRLRDHDINYYLTYHPPEFTQMVWAAAPVVIFAAILLIARLLSWSLALPAVLLYDQTGPAQSFSTSRRLTTGHRPDLLLRFCIWGLAVVVSGFVVGGIATALAYMTQGLGHLGLPAFIAALTIVLLIWAALMTVISAFTTASFASILYERYKHLGGRLSQDEHLGHVVKPAGFVQFFVISAFLIGAAAFMGVRLTQTLSADPEVLVIAHRGAAGLRPENSLPSVEKAIEDGADWVEIDVQESAEGEVIVIHDSDFMKIAGVATKVWDVTREELDQIDVGRSFAPEYTGTRIALLREVLETAKERSKVLIELKSYGHDDRLEERVIEIVEAAGMAEDVAVMSLDAAMVAKMRELRPDWPAGLLAATAVGDLTQLDVDFLAVNTGLAKPSFFRHAGNAGKPVFVWTVDDAESMVRMVSRGADGLITNYPGLAKSVLEARADLSTPQLLLLELADVMGLDIGSRLETASAD